MMFKILQTGKLLAKLVCVADLLWSCDPLMIQVLHGGALDNFCNHKPL